ncbi:MAG: hypothetical protein CL693_13610 [Cellvibrionaceae bacterium]|nr:hypothetical protein [Cellvibrionaceae bacterium]MAZ88671.1 hypothetical protein [Cellvibrionaceae bacterium]|tara:strand:- start:972 stop:1685 length:714 start_codon:yes stop_codon:yes gene_type:complete
MTIGKIYISMTVMPDRLIANFFKSVIHHLKNQTAAFDKIVINIPHVYQRTNSAYQIPQWLKQEPQIIINRCYDLGPATKLLGLYDQLQDDDVVCIVDDDIIYQATMLENLLTALKRHPNALITTKLDEQGSPTGYSGYVFQRRALAITERDLDLLMQHCFCVDDTWLGRIAREKHIPVLGLSNDWRASMDQPKTDQHPDWFELGKHSDRAGDIQTCLCARKTSPTRMNTESTTQPSE